MPFAVVCFEYSLISPMAAYGDRSPNDSNKWFYQGLVLQFPTLFSLSHLLLNVTCHRIIQYDGAIS